MLNAKKAFLIDLQDSALPQDVKHAVMALNRDGSRCRGNDSFISLWRDDEDKMYALLKPHIPQEVIESDDALLLSFWW